MAYCTKCGGEIPEGTSSCRSCDKGTIDAQGSFPDSAAVPKITGDDYVTFIGNNSGKYLARFNKFGMEGSECFRFTWHWPAFFVTSLWMMYRKLYGWAILAFISQLIPLVQLVAPIFWPIMAHYLYYRHAKKNLIQIKQVPSSEETRRTGIAARGGVSPVALSIGILAVLTLFGVLSAVAIPMHSDFLKRAKVQSVVRSMVSVKMALVEAKTAKGRYIDCANAGDVQSRLGVTLDNPYIAKISIKSGAITATVHTTGGQFTSDADGKTLILSPDETGSSWTWGGTVPARYWSEMANRALKDALVESPPR